MIRCRTKTVAATLRIVKSTLRSGLQTTAQDIKHQDPVILNHFISVMWRVGDTITQGSERIKCGRSKFTIENEKCTKRLKRLSDEKRSGRVTLLCDNATYLKVYSISECSQIRSINIRMIRVFE